MSIQAFLIFNYWKRYVRNEKKIFFYLKEYFQRRETEAEHCIECLPKSYFYLQSVNKPYLEIGQNYVVKVQADVIKVWWCHTGLVWFLYPIRLVSL